MRRRIKVTKVKPILDSKDPKIQNRLKLIESTALDLMKLHGVSHFKFKFSGARRCAGSCSSDTIRLSITHALYSDDNDIKNTILHEIAHAIVGLKFHHKVEWQDKAIELGVIWREGLYRK